MIPTRVSAVVVTWNSERDIAACLASLQYQTIKPFEITVVDNASDDSTVEFVALNFPDVALIRLDTNAGFAKGNNIGIKASTGDWLLLLNPDAEVDPTWIERLLEVAEGNPRIGMLGGVLWRSGDGLGQYTVIDSLGIEIYKSRRVRDIGAGEKLKHLPESPWQVFGVCAAAVMLKREMLVDISIDSQIFPERFFCYYEDADLAWRAFRRGWQAWLVPLAIGFHRRGGSPVGNRFSRYYTHRNRLWMILRNDSFGSLKWAFPEIFLHELLMLARVIRYPYLLQAVWQSLTGVLVSIRERKLLPDRGSGSLPFKPGIGFSRAEKTAAILPTEKKIHK